MRHLLNINVIFGLFFAASSALAADVNRHISIEVDPIAPLSASLETKNGNSASMYGGAVDFNLGHISTGPEFWLGAFTRRGSNTANSRMDYLRDGDTMKLDATRLRWNVSLWESNYTMRGWFVRGGLSYTKIQGRGKAGNYFRPLSAAPNPDGLSDSNITDMRQGIMASFGQRWAFWQQSATITLAFSYNLNLRRNVAVDSVDGKARDDYEAILEDIPDARMSTRSVPEAHLGFGYLW